MNEMKTQLEAKLAALEITDTDDEENIEDAGPEGTRLANRLRKEEEDWLDAQYGPPTEP